MFNVFKEIALKRVDPNRRRATSLVLGPALCLALAISPGAGQEEAQPRLNFYPSLQLTFVSGEDRNYFVARTGVVNMSGAVMTDLVMTQTFPKKFAPSLLGERHHSLIHRPPGWEESLEGRVYTVHLPELRIAEATALAVILGYKGRPSEVTFPGVEVEYTLDGRRYEEKGPEQTWDLSKYTKYSGTLSEYIKRYAQIDLKIPPGDDWGFTDLAARISGRVPIGPVEIETTRSGVMRFSLQAGTAGNLRQLLVIRRPLKPSLQLSTAGDIRRYVMGTVRSLADFTLDADEMTTRKAKLGKFDAWVAETRWYDRVKDRLGEGPIRWYIFADEKEGNLYVVAILAQGRGLGPGKADVPNDSKERELMAELEAIVSSMRIL